MSYVFLYTTFVLNQNLQNERIFSGEFFTKQTDFEIQLNLIERFYELILRKKRKSVMLSIPETGAERNEASANPGKRFELSPYGLPILADSVLPLRMTLFYLSNISY
jgi:hypothetical protein